MNIPTANFIARKKIIIIIKKEKRGSHMIKCLLTELGRAGRENICPRSVRYDLRPNIFPSGPPTQSISKKNYRSSALSIPLVNECHITEIRRFTPVGIK